MADNPPPEGDRFKIAYDLMQDVMRAEDKVAHVPAEHGYDRADREYLLQLYVDCLGATFGRMPK